MRQWGDRSPFQQAQQLSRSVCNTNHLQHFLQFRSKNNVHFKLGSAQFFTLRVDKWDGEEFVLSYEDDVIVRLWIELVCRIRWFGGIPACMESVYH